MESVVLKPIGVIHTPFPKPTGTPIPPSRSSHARGRIELLPEFVPGLRDLDGFSHITLVYFLHLSRGFDLAVTPYLDTERRGLFATRAPRRPNPIGLSVVRLIRIDGGTLHIEDIDMVDGTPLLDIKPYVPSFEDVSDCRLGWLEGKANRAGETSADERFEE
jgi:tRNA-Thr(GGU) m(6)t(6)A37 methyltransferase TsaA